MNAFGSVADFRSAIEARDMDALAAALAPDVTFFSPAVFAPSRGREAVMSVLRHAVEVFEDFEYIDELSGGERSGGDTYGLVFRARVGERVVDGWDYLTLDDDGLVSKIVVMVRPLSGLNALVEAMAARLAAG